MTTFAKVLDMKTQKIVIINTDKIIKIRPSYEYPDGWIVQFSDDYEVFISDHEYDNLTKLLNVVDCGVEPSPATPEDDQLDIDDKLDRLHFHMVCLAENLDWNASATKTALEIVLNTDYQDRIAAIKTLDSDTIESLVHRLASELNMLATVIKSGNFASLTNTDSEGE